MTEHPSPAFSGPFRAGDRVQLTGPRGHLHTITLVPGKVFHTHKGPLPHDAIIGQPDGSVVVNEAGVEHLALRPLLTDFVMSMPRGAAIVYPKDAAQILAQADIFPGATVVEAGVGSGALSLWLLRAIGPQGRLASFERRDEFADVARGNVETFFGEVPATWSLTVGDLQEALPATLADGSVDRIVLDMLAPWECVDACAAALNPVASSCATWQPSRSCRAWPRPSAEARSTRIRSRTRRWCAAGTSRGWPYGPTTG